MHDLRQEPRSEGSREAALQTGHRRREILWRLSASGYVGVTELAQELGADPSTIRRDLDALARGGVLERAHGGARLIGTVALDLPYATKLRERMQEKAAIGAAAAGEVRDGDSLFLDSGSTTHEVARALRARRDLTVITNDLRIAMLLASVPVARLLVTGGERIRSVYTLAGDRAEAFVRDYFVNWAFLGADAIDAQVGITNTNAAEVPLKREMIARAERAILVADSSKFGQRALVHVVPIDAFAAIYTDDDLSESDAERYGGRLTRVSVGPLSATTHNGLGGELDRMGDRHDGMALDPSEAPSENDGVGQVAGDGSTVRQQSGRVPLTETR